MKTLIINAQPDFLNDTHFSVRLQQLFLKQFSERFPNEAPAILNLYDHDIPRIETEQLLAVWNKQQAGDELTVEETKIAETSNQLLSQFKAHHRIVIVSPLHNFNVTSRMKDYIDNILIARETFKYTETGSVGLMTDDYKVLLLQASGSIYTNQDRYTPLEFSRFYLEKMFVEMMGFDSFDIVRAEGTNVLSADAVWQSVPQQMKLAFSKFYGE